MSNIKFTINEIITVIMAEVETLEEKIKYGIENEEFNIPRGISYKIDNLRGKEYKIFMEKILEIAEEIYVIKESELNVLNNMHREIVFLVEEKLKEYLQRG